jgi:hypothetical protein
MCRARGESVANPSAEVLALFGAGGDKGHAGKVDFLDGLPLDPACLELDVMSPHHPKYYQGKIEIPHDCEDPVSLPFLRIRPGSRFEIALLLRDARASREVLEEAKKWLLEGLSEWGLGAKTSSGYGVFEVARAGEGERRAEPEKTSAVPAAPTQRRKFVATIDSFSREEDFLFLRPEGDAKPIRVSLQRALARRGWKVRDIDQLRREKIRLDVELDANGEVLCLFERK